MHVFVTGATGHIGSALVPELLAAGHDVTAMARSDSSATMAERLGAGDTVFLPRNVPHTYVLTSEEAELLTICNPAGFEDFIRAAGWNLSVAKPEDSVVDMRALIDAAEATGQRVLGPPLGLGDAMPRRYLDD